MVDKYWSVFETHSNQLPDTGRIISSDGTEIIGIWGPDISTPKSPPRTEIVSNQLVQGSQNRITQTKTNTPNTSSNVNSIITGTIVGAAGIAGIYAVKPSVKQIVNTATQKNASGSEKTLPKKSKLDFEYSSNFSSLGR